MSNVLERSGSIIQSLGLDPKSFHLTSFTFSLKPAHKTWKAFTADNTHFPIYRVVAPQTKIVEIRNFIGGIPAEHYIVLAELDDFAILCMSRHKRGEQPLILALKQDKDYERVANVFRTQNFTSDVLSAHYAIDKSMDLLKSGGEGPFINRGLFSNYFLRERLEKALSERKRDVWREASTFFAAFSNTGGISTDFTSIPKMLNALGYQVIRGTSNEYVLSSPSRILGIVAIVSETDNLDVMSNERTVPSVQAVAALALHPWVILTNGRLWRLYSSRVSSASTNYFEVDLEGVSDEKDPRLKYFVSLFSAAALVPKQEITDLDYIFDGGVQYARELEQDIRTKIFEKQLFLDLVRGILGHSASKKYSDEDLSEAKKDALKLLYRLLFILYAESRGLLPLNDKRYSQISIGYIRERLSAMEKEPEAKSAWDSLQRLFSGISKGDPSVNLPQYDGALFEFDKSIDTLTVRNKHLVPALRALMEIDGKGIDYQNFGVRQLGSLYEALLEYTVRQAETDLAIVKGQILDMKFAKGTKYERLIDEGEIYLTSGGLARKGTGSYFTPDKIVKFLVTKGLEPIFTDREKKFKEELERWRKTGDKEAAAACTKHLFDIQVVDPAMGSGHFLVTVVDEITRWIIRVLEKNPDAPLAVDIGEDRQKIISEQRTKGIELDGELLTFNVILKRMVMKRCVFGVDINPLSVELAKLSLWLDSFTIGTPLTFLDHHIRTGDSLIGMWLEDLKAKRPEKVTLDAWTESVESISDILQQVSYPADLNIKEVQKSKESYEQSRESSKPLRTLLDMQAAAIIDEELQKRLPRNLTLVEEKVRDGQLEGMIWAQPVLEALEYGRKYHFFHWELEFPDAFNDDRRGFDLVVMNPPWEVIEVDDDEFFSQYYPSFKRISKKEEKEIIEQKLLTNKSILTAFRNYVSSIEKRTAFYRSSAYQKQDGKTDTWKLFLERILNLTATDGTMAVLIPSGIVMNESARALRKAILERRIRFLYEFENTHGIFPDVHRSYKFVALVVDNSTPAHDFSAAFYLHDIDSVNNNTGKEREKFVSLSNDLIQLVSPRSASIPEVRNKRDVSILRKIYKNNQLLDNGIKSAKGTWTFHFVEEFNRGSASRFFKESAKGWSLIEGKNFHQFIPDYEKPAFKIKENEGLEWTSRIREYGKHYKEIHKACRLAFRDVGRPTDTRTMIACIIPSETFTTDKAPVMIPRKDRILALDNDYYMMISYMLGIFNSTTFDFIVRCRVTATLSFFLLEQTPIPSKFEGILGKRIANIAARLSCPDKRFEDLAKACTIRIGSITISERIRMIAELDALAAHNYGLDRDEYEYIINTFDSFEEDKNLENLKKGEWSDSIIRKLNGEVRKRVLDYYDTIAKELEEKASA